MTAFENALACAKHEGCDDDAAQRFAEWYMRHPADWSNPFAVNQAYDAWVERDRP